MLIMKKTYYSHRSGTNPNLAGLKINQICEIFIRIFKEFENDGFFDEAFGFFCSDEQEKVPGKIRDIDLDIILKIRKENLWPIELCAPKYSEDDLFDIIEYLYENISKPIEGHLHNWNDCGMHWETFNQSDGQDEFRSKINDLLIHYEHKFELSNTGDVLAKPEVGFEIIFDADIPSSDPNVRDRMDVAVVNFRKHGATLEDRRQAVRTLADVLEYLKPHFKKSISSKDEGDLFNIANNFGIRHHNQKQKTNYDASLWLSWMFYFYLSTIHMILRKIKVPD